MNTDLNRRAWLAGVLAALGGIPFLRSSVALAVGPALPPAEPLPPEPPFHYDDSGTGELTFDFGYDVSGAPDTSLVTYIYDRAGNRVLSTAFA